METPVSHDEKIDHVDVAIIGAGWYGLVAARLYLRLCPNASLTIIDSDKTVGGVWSKERLYPNLVAQVRLGLFNYSDTPMPPNGGNAKDPQVTGEMIHDYLQNYAEKHNLIKRIRFETFVQTATKIEEGWRLELRDSNVTLETKKLIVATGVTSIPYMPDIHGTDNSIPVIHSRDLGAAFEDIKRANIEEIVVVGAAKSAYDAVYLLLKMGKTVTWVIRSEGAGPLAILPFKILDTFNSIAVASTRLMTYLSPSILNADGLLAWAFHRTAPGRFLVGSFWSILDRISGIHAGYADGDHVAMLRPEIDRQSVFWAHSGLGVVTLPDFWRTLHSTRLTVLRDEISTIKEQTIHLRSGGHSKADYLVMCTGWGDHFSMFDQAHKGMLGLPTLGDCIEDKIDWLKYDMEADSIVNGKLPFLAKPPNLVYQERLNPRQQNKWRLYRRSIPVSLGATGDRSLAILGQIHTVQTPLVAEVQSFWTILYLLGMTDVPDRNTMAKEVSLWNAWTRKRYLNQGQKFPYSLYDFLPYVDSIFQDLNLVSHRKSNAIAEFFSPYKPEDFNGFVDEYLKINGRHIGNNNN